MLKLSNLIIVILLVFSCNNSKKEKETMIFEPHIRQYLDIYLNDNNKINSRNNVIILKCSALGENEYILDILSEMPVNMNYSYTELTDSIYVYNFKSFKVFIIDDNHKLLKGNYNDMELLKEHSNSDIPISYNGPFWNIKIKNDTIVDFTYQFCKPDTVVLEQLKSIAIPTS